MSTSQISTNKPRDRPFSPPPSSKYTPATPNSLICRTAKAKAKERKKTAKRQTSRKRKNTCPAVSPTLHRTGRTRLSHSSGPNLGFPSQGLPIGHSESSHRAREEARQFFFFSGERGKRKESDNVVGRLCIGHLRAPPQLQHGHRKGRGHLLPRPQPHLFRQVHLQEEFGAGEVSGRQREPRLRCPARKGLCPRLLEATGEPGGFCSLPREDTMRDPGWGCPHHGNR